MQLAKYFHTISGGVVSGWSSIVGRSSSFESSPVKIIIAVLSKSTDGCVEIAFKG